LHHAANDTQSSGLVAANLRQKKAADAMPAASGLNLSRGRKQIQERDFSAYRRQYHRIDDMNNAFAGAVKVSRRVVNEPAPTATSTIVPGATGFV
jgi:hypothetical protein